MFHRVDASQAGIVSMRGLSSIARLQTHAAPLACSLPHGAREADQTRLPEAIPSRSPAVVTLGRISIDERTWLTQ